MAVKEIPIWEKTALTIEEVAEYSNIGPKRLSELLTMPRCPFVLYVKTRDLSNDGNLKGS